MGSDGWPPAPVQDPSSPAAPVSRQAEAYRVAAVRREAAVEALLWDEERAQWFDYDLERRCRRDGVYPSNFFPLWAGCLNVQRDAVRRGAHSHGARPAVSAAGAAPRRTQALHPRATAGADPPRCGRPRAQRPHWGCRGEDLAV